ncbi:hypothetical protein Tco_0670346 [Tanacetum coccineum]
MINHVNNWEKANKEQNNESITTELERYKEMVKNFEKRLNINLSRREKMIDSQMDDMIREKLTLKEQIDLLEQNLSKQIKEKESLFKTFTVFKNESKEKENKYMENEIDLEKKIKELDNIICKAGYQNPFYLKKTQRIKPTLYDGAVISNTHVAMPVIDDGETLILEEESRSKMSKKAKDPEVVAKKISHKPIDYEKLNRLTEDFGKRFSPQQELSAEQAFWFHTLNPTIEPSSTPPVIVDVPSELPKVSLVNASLKKLKFYLTQFDSVVKKRTTPSALEKDLLNEITKVQTVFDQMEASVQQFSVDKKCLEIAKKEILLENDRLLQKIMSQDVLLTVMNSMSLNNDSVNMEMQKCESLSMQLKQEIFQNDESCVTKNVVEIPEYFEINDLKARLQDKDKTICELKDTIKSLRENTKEQNVNHDKCELEPINKELENSVAKFLSENERMFKLDLVPLPPRLLQNRDAHIDYLRHTQEQANTLREIVEQAKAKQPLDSELDFACKYATRIQELLAYVQDTCPNAITPSTKKVESFNTLDSNTHVLSSIGVKCSTSNCGSKPPGNKRNDRIPQKPIAFRKNACFIRNLEVVDLLSVSQDTNLYTISLDDMLKSSLVCLLSKASKIKSWLWHRRLSHLNLGRFKVGFKQLGLGVEQESMNGSKMVRGKQPEEKTNTDCLVKEQEKEYQTGWKIKTGNVLDSCHQRSTQQCTKSGVAKHLGVAGLQQQNGLVEEINVTLLALIQSGLSKVLWAEDTTRRVPMQVLLRNEEVLIRIFACEDDIPSRKDGLKDDMDAPGQIVLLLRSRFNKGLRIKQREMYLIDNGNPVRYNWSGHFKLSLKDCRVRDCDVKG